MEEQGARVSWQTSPLKEGCGQGKEFEHIELHAVFNTRIVTGFRSCGLTILQSKTKAAGEVQ